MRRTQLVAALLVCAVIGLPRGGSAQIIQDSRSPFTAAVGSEAAANTTGSFNTAIGALSLFTNTTGKENTATGFEALYSQTAGIANTATGYQALQFNTTGWYNTASGSQALINNITGYLNTATGAWALGSNSTGWYNTATGSEALIANTTGWSNTASGFQTLISNTTGGYNTATGYQALVENTTGTYNTALGTSAGQNATTGSYNVFIGADVIGTASDTNTIRIGLPYGSPLGSRGSGQNQAFIAGIYGTTVTQGLPVVIDANGQLGTIEPQGGSELILKVIRLQQEVGDLSARIARLESLLAGAGTREGK